MVNLYFIILLYFAFKIYQTGKLSSDRDDFINRFIRKNVLSIPFLRKIFIFDSKQKEKDDQKVFSDVLNDFENDLEKSKFKIIRNNSHHVQKMKLIGTATSRYWSAAVGIGALMVIVPAVGFIWWQVKLYLHDHFGPAGNALVNVISGFLLLPALLVVMILYIIITVPIAAMGKKK